MNVSTSVLPALQTIRVQPLAEGVYAAISLPGQGSMCNAGIVDLGDCTLVFDTLRTPRAATELYRAAEQLLGRPVRWIVNSHWHDDHVGGNQVFLPSASAIIATERTREIMATTLAAEYAQDAQELPDFLRSLEAQLISEIDPHKREQIVLRLAENQLYADALPTITLTLPTLLFERALVLRGTRRTVELRTYGGGHTESDVFLYLPEERIAFMGDLAFLEYHPWLPDGNPNEWVRILEQAEQLPLTTIVPGHGPVTDTSSLALTRQYIQTLQRLAEQAVSSSTPEDQLDAITIPQPFDTWGYAQFFTTNMRFLMQTVADEYAPQ